MGGGVGEVQKKYSRKAKLNEKKFLRLKNSPPLSHNFSISLFLKSMPYGTAPKFKFSHDPTSSRSPSNDLQRSQLHQDLGIDVGFAF